MKKKIGRIVALLLAGAMVLQSPMASIGVRAADVETGAEGSGISDGSGTSSTDNLPEAGVQENTDEGQGAQEPEGETAAEEIPEGTPQEQQVLGIAKVFVSYSDESNLANRQEKDGAKLFRVYADETEMAQQPPITLDSGYADLRLYNS